MIPGRDQVITCPICKEPARCETFASGNTFRVEMWTDLYRVFPMMPFPPNLIECHACRHCFWLKDAGVLGLVDPRGRFLKSDEDAAWLRSPRVKWPDAKAIYGAIAAGLCRSEDEMKGARLIALQRRNDVCRQPQIWQPPGPDGTQKRYLEPFFPPAPPAGPEDIDNLEELLRLAPLPAEGAIHYEISRYLGRFDEAMESVEAIASGGAPEGVIAFLRSLCARLDKQVRRVDQDLFKPTPISSQ